jgi:hypothetical protein
LFTLVNDFAVVDDICRDDGSNEDIVVATKQKNKDI